MHLLCGAIYTRGEEVSRACAADIIAEAQALMVAQGVCEITLLGQNVNAWRDPESGVRLDGLLAAAIGEIARGLSAVTLHHQPSACDMGGDMDAELIAAHMERIMKS